MRFVLALLLAAAVASPAAAQQAKPAQPLPSPAQPPSQAKPSSQEEIMRQRILLRERFNKGWDIQRETPQEKARRCKAEARKQFSAFHPLKRRRYAKECVASPSR